MLKIDLYKCYWNRCFNAVSQKDMKLLLYMMMICRSKLAQYDSCAFQAKVALIVGMVLQA